MWLYVQTWLPLLSISLTAAICFGVASFVMEQAKPRTGPFGIGEPIQEEWIDDQGHDLAKRLSMRRIGHYNDLKLQMSMLVARADDEVIEGGGGSLYVVFGSMLLKKDFEGVSEQDGFKTSIKRARLIQEVGTHDSIVARQRHAADFFNSIGH